VGVEVALFVVGGGGGVGGGFWWYDKVTVGWKMRRGGTGEV